MPRRWPLPAAEFLSRWLDHIIARRPWCFLPARPLALSVERKVIKGVDAWVIVEDILIPSAAVIALLDPTQISEGSWILDAVSTELTAIGLSMMCMAAVRRLADVGAGGGPLACGSLLVKVKHRVGFWHPPDNPSVLAAFLVAPYGAPGLSIKYAHRALAGRHDARWVFGRHLSRFRRPASARLSGAARACVVFFSGNRRADRLSGCRPCVSNTYGNMWRTRSDNSWRAVAARQQVPAIDEHISARIGASCCTVSRSFRHDCSLSNRRVSRETAVFYVFGPDGDVSTTWVQRWHLRFSHANFGLRGVPETSGDHLYGVALWPGPDVSGLSSWYRSFKKRPPTSVTEVSTL
jgi:hypothetical protein